jgi:hypothetical protein
VAEVLGRIAIRLALCAACSWIVWRLMGLTAMVTTAPLYGVAMARPLLDLASDLRHAAKARILRKLEVRHYAYRGVPIQVFEDDTGLRWIRIDDVREVGATTSTDGVFAIAFPDGCQRMGRPPQAHLSHDALLAHLKKDRSPTVLHFTNWVERNIAFPARAYRARQGFESDTRAQRDPPMESGANAADQSGRRVP